MPIDSLELPCCKESIDHCLYADSGHAVRADNTLTAESAARLAKYYSRRAGELADECGFDAEADIHEWPASARVRFFDN